MAREKEAREFHKQLVRMASSELRRKGYRPVQHVAIEKAGRPDVAGRDEEGKFSLIVECMLREPTSREIEELSNKYVGRKLVLAIPSGLPIDMGRIGNMEIWEFPVKRGGKVFLPLGGIEIDPSLWDSLSSHIKAGEVGQGQLVRLLVEALDEKLRQRKKKRRK